jgi:hypothetical protein
VIEILCAALRHGSVPMSDAWARQWLGAAYEPFQKIGLLRRCEPLDEVLCAVCFEQHWVPREWEPEGQHHFAYCPIGGDFDVDDADVARVAVDMERCLALVRSALAGHGSSTRELVPGRAWYLGEVATAGLDWNAILMVGRPDGTEVTELLDQVAQLRVRMLDVVIGTERFKFPERRVPRLVHTIPLFEVTDFKDGRIVARSDVLGGWLHSFQAEGQHSAGRVGRPPNKKEWLEKKIPEIKAELLACTTDTERCEVINRYYRREHGIGTISRTYFRNFLAFLGQDHGTK